ncbi:histidinol-phosphate transaminase [Sandaracinobacteroides saxicola]|uniref:Histidinol-phosphate aminotransferase n=1 Tax=Sandaracinobacteroides saxicola TaxID=2759707 RepID=A0A7G5ILS5_9SPHN|nr:histidinol-phosphate transaminase [Sandaracinobacteroides saxicola]QMW24317.1 histidinol-phosphate transaminase [Sandaracinobacteroides saxicola]
MNSLPTVNPWIDQLAPYVAGSAKAPGHAHPVKLSSNENPWGASPRALDAMREAAAAAHRYPEGSATILREALATLHNLDPDRIVCGTGSDEILQLIPSLYCAPGDSVVYVRHGFMVYPIAARRAGAEPIAAPDTNYTADVDALLATIRPDTRVVFLANPNNPTGTMIPASDVARLHAGLRPDIVLVLDQAYAEYLDAPDPDGALALATTAANVVATRTFSKIYGLGGARVGWATGPKAIIDNIAKVRAPFSVSNSAIAAATAALADQAFVATCRAENNRLRAELVSAIEGLGNHGLTAIPSVANFVLMACPTQGPLAAPAIHAGLMARGFITRHLPGQGLPHAVRISIGTEPETRGVIAALRDLAAA